MFFAKISKYYIIQTIFCIFYIFFIKKNLYIFKILEKCIKNRFFVGNVIKTMGSKNFNIIPSGFNRLFLRTMG